MYNDSIEIVEHTADWSLYIKGGDLKELFVHAAVGMAMLMVEDLQTLPADVERDIQLEAYDAESLLVDWLNELAYWAEIEQLVMYVIDISEISETHLAARVRGGEAPAIDKHIKAATFHNLSIQESTNSGLEVTIVFDV